MLRFCLAFFLFSLWYLLAPQMVIGQEVFVKTCLQNPETLKKMSLKQGFFVSTINNSKSKKVVFDYRLANTTETMSFGFQYSCPETIAKTQILFQFQSPSIPYFHMNNVEAPLDIAFIDANGFIIDIFKMGTYKANEVRPLYKPSSPALYALEARLGYFDEKIISVGDRVVLPN